MDSVMSKCIAIRPNLDKIQKTISIKFGVNLSQEQLLQFIETQPQELRKALKAESVNLDILDLLIITVSEAITGMHYPNEESTPYYKECYQKKLKENRARYFKL